MIPKETSCYNVRISNLKQRMTEEEAHLLAALVAGKVVRVKHHGPCIPGELWNNDIRPAMLKLLPKKDTQQPPIPGFEPEQARVESHPAYDAVPSVTLKTIFGNVAHIQIPRIREMCWYAAGYAVIFTDFGQYTAQMTRTEFQTLADLRIVK